MTRSSWPIYDAHNHWHQLVHSPSADGAASSVLPPALEKLTSAWAESGIVAGLVNGTHPEDWAAVHHLSLKYANCLPSYGVHPWEVDHLPDDWTEQFCTWVGDTHPVGEIGLDLWKNKENLPRQLEVFRWQWNYAAKHHLPVTIHCLRAWPELMEELQKAPKNERGFLLHAFGGPASFLPGLLELGAYFSFSTAFLPLLPKDPPVKKRVSSGKFRPIVC
jgi:TatD DNase family protein